MTTKQMKAESIHQLRRRRKGSNHGRQCKSKKEEEPKYFKKGDKKMNMAGYNKKLILNGRDFIFPEKGDHCGNCHWFLDTETHPVIDGKPQLRSKSCGECNRFPSTVKKDYFDTCGEYKEHYMCSVARINHLIGVVNNSTNES